jgi:hypothetical protein
VLIMKRRRPAARYAIRTEPRLRRRNRLYLVVRSCGPAVWLYMLYWLAVAEVLGHNGRIHRTVTKLAFSAGTHRSNIPRSSSPHGMPLWLTRTTRLGSGSGSGPSSLPSPRSSFHNAAASSSLSGRRPTARRRFESAGASATSTRGLRARIEESEDEDYQESKEEECNHVGHLQQERVRHSTHHLLSTRPISRRSAIQQASVWAAGMVAGTATGLVLSPRAACAGRPEIDERTGQLFTPKSEMLSGRGSAAARGIRVDESSASASGGGSRKRLQPGQVLQTVYETRFIAYLSRFLLNYDPAAHAWWVNQGVGDTWDPARSSSKGDPSKGLPRKAMSAADSTFAEFCESVEIGLSDYFVGPYGSYSSLDAMTAGLSATQPAKSQRPNAKDRKAKSGAGASVASSNYDALAKQGILNLYTLLKARYTSLSAKKQLAILFSFISLPSLQPTAEIAGLLGEADNATVSRVQLVGDASGRLLATVPDESSSRTSPRRGGGYSLDDVPTIAVDPPPALGGAYPPAVARPVMKATGRVLKLAVTDGGYGYLEAPRVRVTQGGVRRVCQASAILDRTGRVESIVVLDPGYGYGGVGTGQGRKVNKPPVVRIDPPPTPAKGQDKSSSTSFSSIRTAKATAVLEYAIADIELVQGGAGYVKAEPPAVRVSPPREDPDWFVNIQEQPELRMVPLSDQFEGVQAQVTEMKLPDGNIAYSLLGAGLAAAAPTLALRQPQIDDALLERLQRDPLELLPLWVRPQRRPTLLPSAPTLADRDRATTLYTIPVLESVPQVVAVMNPRYRAYDPVFGGVGKVPVTKGALELNAGEYARLALSGAVCTVVVRTLLNPLELVKTKQQLKNDPELFDYVIQKKLAMTEEAKSLLEKPRIEDSLPGIEALNAGISQSDDTDASLVGASTAVEIPHATVIAEVATPAVPVGTIDLLRGIAELRGPFALFQSADITFLASLAFGSFGFGATELFRRSFTAFFFTGDAADSGGSEIVLLIAAALATVLTAGVAAPFELLRVRSMGLLESTKWTVVLQEYVVRSCAWEWYFCFGPPCQNAHFNLSMRLGGMF